MSSSTATAMTDRLQVVPTGAALAGEVRGVDLRGIDDGAFAAIHRAWLDHLVLLFRGQDMDDDDLIAFSRRFGELDLAPIQENGRRFVEGHPEIYVVSNVIENGVAIGSLGAGEAVWHTDMSYLEDPPKASMLYAIEVPPAGGSTGFTNMYRAYEELPEALKRRVEGRRLKHDGTYNSGGYVREGIAATDDPVASPGTCHPIVCAHPETGRRCLYLGRRRNAYIEGLPLAEFGGVAGRPVALRDARGAELVQRVARRRSCSVGQPLHDAPARSVRCGKSADHASHADEGPVAAGVAVTPPPVSGLLHLDQRDAVHAAFSHRDVAVARHHHVAHDAAT